MIDTVNSNKQNQTIAETGVIAEMIYSTWCIRKYLIQLGVAYNKDMVTVSTAELRNN